MGRKIIILGKSVELPPEWALKTEKQQKLWIRYQQSKMKKRLIKAKEEADKQGKLFE